MSQWQPIDTCPKDGSPFRAWVVAGERVASENEHAFQITPVFTKAFPVEGAWKEVDRMGLGYVDYIQGDEHHDVEDVLFWQPLEAKVIPPEGFLL